jgi:hypothetical protein
MEEGAVHIKIIENYSLLSSKTGKILRIFTVFVKNFLTHLLNTPFSIASR